jgi:PKD repeat protein
MDSTTCVVEVLPVNQLPIANIVADVDEEYTDVPITFIGVNSTDVDGWLVAFYWDFGDNTTANVTIEDGLLIKNQTHSYKRTGTYKIRLTVVDNRGGTAETMIEIYIKNRLPIADAGSDQTVNYEDQPVDFDGRASQDPEGTMLNYTWMIELPDGALIFLYGDTPSYFFEQPGEYEVILTVTDEDGGVDEDTVKIIIKKVTKPSGRPTGGFLYGFELIALIIAICICILVAASSSWSKRRK